MITLQEVEAALEGSEYSVIRHRGERTKYVFIGDHHEQNDALTADFMRRTGSRISTIFLEGAKGVVEYRKDDFRLGAGLLSFPFEGYYCPNELIKNLLRADVYFFRSFLKRGGRIICNDHEGLLKKQVESARTLWLELNFRHHKMSNDYDEEDRKFRHIARERSKKMLKALLRDRGTLIVQVVGARHLDDFWHSHFTDFITIGRPGDFTWAAETENAAH